jgi:hypothetical protein
MENSQNQEQQIEVPLEFPDKISDKSLADMVRTLTWGIVTTSMPSNSNKYSACAQLGMSEMNNRATKKNSIFLKRSTILSLSVSACAVIFTTYSSLKNYKATSEWETKQLKAYDIMSEQMRVTNLKLDSLTSSINHMNKRKDVKKKK